MKPFLHAGILSVILTTLILGNASDLRGDISSVQYMGGEPSWEFQGVGGSTAGDYIGEVPVGGAQPWGGQPGADTYTTGNSTGGAPAWTEPAGGLQPGADAYTTGNYTEGTPAGTEPAWGGQPGADAYTTGNSTGGAPTGAEPAWGGMPVEWQPVLGIQPVEGPYDPAGEYRIVEGAGEALPQGEEGQVLPEEMQPDNTAAPVPPPVSAEWTNDETTGDTTITAPYLDDAPGELQLEPESDTTEKVLGTDSGIPPPDGGEIGPTQGVLQKIGDTATSAVEAVGAAVTSTFEAIGNVVTSVADTVFGLFSW